MRRLLSRDSSILNFPLHKTKNVHCFEACYQTFKVFMASQDKFAFFTQSKSFILIKDINQNDFSHSNEGGKVNLLVWTVNGVIYA